MGSPYYIEILINLEFIMPLLKREKTF